MTSQQPAYIDDLCAAVEEIGGLRWTLRQITVLASGAPALTNVEPGARRLTLAESCAGELVPALGSRPGQALDTWSVVTRSVHALCGAEFQPFPLAYGGTFLPGNPLDPDQVCPECRK